MNGYLLIILLCCIISIIILIIILNKKKKVLERVIIQKHKIEVARKEELKEYFNEEFKREKERIDKELTIYEGNVSNRKQELENQYKLDASKYNADLDKLKIQLTEKEKRYEEVNQDLDLYREGKMKEIDGTAAEYEQRKRQEIESFFEKQLHEMTEIHNQRAEDYNNQEKELKEQIETIKTELEEERRKRAAVNEEIRRQKEVEMKQDFYRIQFNEEDKNDVEILRSIAPRLRHPEAINKVIWSAYYQKPLAELRKRVAIEGSGIYKITRIKTGEIYIGQARNVSTRFAEHCKAALGVGTLASSQLHRVMQNDGCENFLFELLEEVPVEKLKERESYYIDFYDSKNYGLNTIRGEQNK